MNNDLWLCQIHIMMETIHQIVSYGFHVHSLVSPVQYTIINISIRPSNVDNRNRIKKIALNYVHAILCLALKLHLFNRRHAQVTT